MRKMGYKASLQWIIDNDDTEWVKDEYGSPSVTIYLITDIFGYDIEKVVGDLKSAIIKNRAKIHNRLTQG